MALTKIRNRMIADAPAQVTDFGASPALADNTAAFQAALNTGLDVTIPDGDWKLSGPITITTSGQYLTGSGGNCRLLSTSTINDMIRVGNGSTEISEVVISDIRFYATVVKSGGAAIRFRKALRCHVETCMVSSPQDFQTLGAKLWDGVVFEACADCKIDGCSMWGFGQDAVRLYGDDIYNGEINITGGSWITYASRYGVACLGRFGGLRLDSGDISACWRNLCIDQSATPGFPNREIFISGQFSLDASGDANIWVGPNGVSTLECNGMWTASAGRTTIGPSSGNGEGIHIDPNNANLTLRITGGKIFNNTGAGVTMNSGRLYMQGVLVTSNGLGSGLSDHGFWMPAASGNSGPIQITDCTFEGNAGYDIKLDNQLAYSCVTDNVLRGSGVGTISMANTTSATNIVARNIGYKTYAQGSGTITTGQTGVVVTHGLVGLPSNVQITPLSSLPEGGSFFVSNVTATTFTVEIGSAAGGARSFYWSAWFGVQV